jgi:hypothetical protein
MSIRFKSIIIIFLSLCLLPGASQQNYNDSHKYYDRKNGLVPDKVTAEKIAEIILVNIYGESVRKQKPFIVTLKNNNIWVIQGRWNSKDMNLKGGVAYIEIQKSDCKILKVIHGK